MDNPQSQELWGGCYCGCVRFCIAANATPIGTLYCHCIDCQQAHATPLYQAAFVKEEDFRVVQGDELLNWYTRDESRRQRLRRYFCTLCGSKVFNRLKMDTGRLEGIEIRVVFPTLFDDRAIAKSDLWAPKVHIYSHEAFLDLAQLVDGVRRVEIP